MKKFRLVDIMAEDDFQDQTYPGYTAIDSYLNEATTSNTAIKVVDGAFDILRDPVYPVYVDAPRNPYSDVSMAPYTMAANTVADSIIGSTNLDIQSHVCPCDSYLDGPMTLNAEVGIPAYTTGDFDGNKLLTLSTEADNQLFPNSDELLVLNLASSAVNDTYNIQNPICSDFDEPTNREFQKWKENWDEKMLLVQLKREGKDWEDIMSLMRMKTRNGNTRKSMLQRADSEIEALGKAAAADREGEADRLRDLTLSHTLGSAVRFDYDGVWARISESMKRYGSERKWSSHRVKYAWNHGVAGLFPHILLRQRTLFQAILI